MDSENVTGSVESNGEGASGDELESQSLEGSLDVAFEEAGKGEGCYRQGGNGAVQDVMEPASHTLEEVMNMEFENPEAAVRFYEQYSRARGFSMRHGRKLKNKSGEIVRYTFLCNREGFRSRKWLEMLDRKRGHKAVTRCGCRAELRIKPKGRTGRWHVSRFLDEHNHELLPAKFVEHLPPCQNISDVDVEHMDSPREVGNMHNVVRQQGMSHNADVNATLRFFELCAKSDEKMYWRYQVSSDQHLCDLFWSDGRSQEDYSLFGDVLAFDATYGRNKYNMPVIVFSGVNHHNETCVFGTAMVSCESQASYVWVLRQFLNCMGGKSPRAVITDGDRSMRLAIQEVFPEAHHRLCSWHLLKNATVNICKPRFTTLLKDCMLADIEAEEFEMQWEAMVDECGVREVEWVKDLYEKKSLWATAYIRGCFYAGLRTTSRCESLHAKLGRFVEKRYGILEFVKKFQQCVDFLRDKEDELDFGSYHGTPVLQTEFPELEKSGAAEFTREIFLQFQETLKRSVRISVLECHGADEIDVYVTQKYRKPEMRWSVEHHKESNCFRCSCLRMESFGLPCDHILAVLVRLDMCSLPKSLILQRWSKNAKIDILLGGGICGNDEGETSHVYKSRVCEFLQLCKRFARVACKNENDFKNCSAKVVEEIKLLEVRNEAAVDGGCNVEQFNEGPIGVRTKGTGRGNEPTVSRGVKRHKCSTCGELGHCRTTCPNGTQLPAKSSQETTGNAASLVEPFHCMRQTRSRSARSTNNNEDDVQMSRSVNLDLEAALGVESASFGL